MTSSSDSSVHGEAVRHRVAAAGAVARGVRGSASARVEVRVIDRTPPPPPAPKVDVAPLARALESGFAAVRSQVEGAFAAIEKECIELALAAAERIVRRKAELGELDLEGPLRELLAARRRELGELAATLRLHPDDAQALAPKVRELAPPGARIEVVADSTRRRGELSLELGAARLVRTLEHDFERLRQRLLAGGGE